MAEPLSEARAALLGPLPTRGVPVATAAKAKGRGGGGGGGGSGGAGTAALGGVLGAMRDGGGGRDHCHVVGARGAAEAILAGFRAGGDESFTSRSTMRTVLDAGAMGVATIKHSDGHVYAWPSATLCSLDIGVL